MPGMPLLPNPAPPHPPQLQFRSHLQAFRSPAALLLPLLLFAALLICNSKAAGGWPVCHGAPRTGANPTKASDQCSASACLAAARAALGRPTAQQPHPAKPYEIPPFTAGVLPAAAAGVLLLIGTAWCAPPAHGEAAMPRDLHALSAGLSHAQATAVHESLLPCA